MVSQDLSASLAPSPRGNLELMAVSMSKGMFFNRLLLLCRIFRAKSKPAEGFWGNITSIMTRSGIFLFMVFRALLMSNSILTSCPAFFKTVAVAAAKSWSSSIKRM